MSELKIYEDLKEVVEERVALKIANVITKAVGFYEKMVTKEEFKELKAVVKELAEAQKKTENAILELTKGLKNLRKDFGGFSLTMSYAFEN